MTIAQHLTGTYAIAALPMGDIIALAQVLPNMIADGSVGVKSAADDFQDSSNGSRGKLSIQIVASVHLKYGWIFVNPICSVRKEKNS